MSASETALTMNELIAQAHRVLPRPVWDYLIGGSETETTIIRNRAALDSREFQPRVLRDVSHIDLSTELFGRKVALPVFLAPIGSLALLDADAGLAAARAASAAGIPMFMSLMAQPALETVASEMSSPLVFQLYVRGGEEWLAQMIDRAETANCAGLCLTVDAPVYGRRERDLANRFSPAAAVDRPNFSERGIPAQIAPEQAAFNWKSVQWIRRRTRLPLILKGIMAAEDAVFAVEHGVDVIYVSNHGGRQIDHAPGALDLLEEIMCALRGRCEVLVDGGFLRGTDILKALALGAKAVGLGKLQGLALAAGGSEGLARALSILREELTVNMALLGCDRLSMLGTNYVRRSPFAATIGRGDPYPGFGGNLPYPDAAIENSRHQGAKK
jgi:isopentenyl diphosphate isomerase/L-lactate dehydrogenase-like FMN-dependent dehydrogenase